MPRRSQRYQKAKSPLQDLSKSMVPTLWNLMIDMQGFQLNVSQDVFSLTQRVQKQHGTSSRLRTSSGRSGLQKGLSQISDRVSGQVNSETTAPS